MIWFRTTVNGNVRTVGTGEWRIQRQVQSLTDNHSHNYHSVIMEREPWLNVRGIKWKDICATLTPVFFLSFLFCLSLFLSLSNSLWLVVCGTARWLRGQVLSVVCVVRICSRSCAVNRDEVERTVKNETNSQTQTLRPNWIVKVKSAKINICSINSL